MAGPVDPNGPLGATQSPIVQNRFESLLDALGWLLFQFRVSLEEGPPLQFPRWWRIAAAQRLGRKHETYQLARAGVAYWLEVMSAIQELLLDLRELLSPYSSYEDKLLNTLQELRNIINDPNAVTVSSSLFPTLSPSLTGLQGILDRVIQAVDLLPTVQDVDSVGNQIYALLCIRSTPPPTTGRGWKVPDAVDLAGTGRLRLLQWAFDLPWMVRGLGPASNAESISVPVSRLGCRWLRPGDATLQAPVGRTVFVEGVSTPQRFPAYELYFNAAETNATARTADLVGLHKLLESLDYFAGDVREDLRYHFHPALSQALTAFQAVNGLPRSGLLDDRTLNQLFHLDSQNFTVKRALPLDPQAYARIPWPPPLPPRVVVKEITKDVDVFDLYQTPIDGDVNGKLPLVNPDANTPQDEGVTLRSDSLSAPSADEAQLRRGRSYRWYPVGQRPSQNGIAFPQGILRGWIQHSGEQAPQLPTTTDKDNSTPLESGFVGLEKREKDASSGYDGGADTEGDTPNGRFFFCARHQAPSMAGRKGPPLVYVESPVNLPGTARIGIYQWVDLETLWERLPLGAQCTLVASVNVRVKVEADGSMPSGRLVLALVERAAWQARAFATRFDPSLQQVDEKQHPLACASVWFPAETPSYLAALAQKRRHKAIELLANHWVGLKTETLTFTRTDIPAPALYVGLHARGSGSPQPFEDLGVYFDGLEVTWARLSPHQAPLTSPVPAPTSDPTSDPTSAPTFDQEEAP